MIMRKCYQVDSDFMGTVKSFNFVGTQFRGLTTLDMFVSS